MSFVESNLLDDEQVIYRAKLHWCIFIRPTIILFLYPVLEAIIMYNFSFLDILDFLISPIRAGVLSVAVIYFIFVIVDYQTTEIFVTNRRISCKKGIISRYSVDIKLDMVEAVRLSQGIIGRVSNYGHVSLTGVGAMVQKFHGVYDPLGLRNTVIKQINSKI